MTDPKARPPPLPMPVRNAAMLALVVSAMVGFGAAQELAQVIHLEELAEAQQRYTLPGLPPEATEKALSAYRSALKSMRDSRAVILAALCTTCSLAFVSAVRLKRPGLLSRDGVRRLLGNAAIAGAILRTLDGAQLAVVMRRYALALEPAVLATRPDLPLPPGSFTSLLVGASVALSAAMAFAFAFLGVYFRSEKVRQIVAFADRESQS